jgi:hypothetical protein
MNESMLPERCHAEAGLGRARFWSRALSLAALALAVLHVAAAAPEKPRETAVAATPAAGILAAVSGPVWVDRPGESAPLRAALGMRLAAGDYIRCEEGAVAGILLEGGTIITVSAGSSVEITRMVDTQPPQGKVAPGSARRIARGLDTISESLVVGTLRGGGPPPVPLLAPAGDEVILEERPAFFWAEAIPPGTMGVRLVVEHAGKEVWRSGDLSGSTLRYPAAAPLLRAGEAHAWRIDDPRRSGSPVAGRFRMATEAEMDDARAFEAEAAALMGSSHGAAMADFMRCAYYQEIGAWSRLLAAASRLPTSESAATFAHQSRGLAVAGLGITPAQAAGLASRLQDPPD